MQWSYTCHCGCRCAAVCLVRATPPGEYPTLLFIGLWSHSFHKIMYFYSIEFCLVSTMCCDATITKHKCNTLFLIHSWQQGFYEKCVSRLLISLLLLLVYFWSYQPYFPFNLFSYFLYLFMFIFMSSIATECDGCSLVHRHKAMCRHGQVSVLCEDIDWISELQPEHISWMTLAMIRLCKTRGTGTSCCH